jgi:hypothetical protein
MSTKTLRSIAADAIRSTQSNTSIAGGAAMSADKDVTISNLSFEMDQQTEREVEEKRSKILDILGQGSATADSVR